MHMLYNSESFVVVLFDVATDTGTVPGGTTPEGASLRHGGYEIVDKFARKGIFIQGALAESFKQGVEALIETRPSEEEIDTYIERFASLMQQPVILH
jgi:Protein of unknown function (DUF3567)